MTSYTHPDALVETGWLAERLDDPTIRIVDVGFDSGTYSEDHLPGAVAWSWKDDVPTPRGSGAAASPAPCTSPGSSN
jgi:thiosulfate/3-mercaptopyruvate sulfurtransferase